MIWKSAPTMASVPSTPSFTGVPSSVVRPLAKPSEALAASKVTSISALRRRFPRVSAMPTAPRTSVMARVEERLLLERGD